MQKLFQDYPVEQRKQMLADNCQHKEVAIMQVPLKPEEILNVTNTILSSSDKIDVLQTELQKAEIAYKATKKEIQRKLAPIQLDLSVALESKRTGTKQVEGEVYMFDDRDLGMMITYNSEGHHIHSRPLTPKERQLSIFSINAKTGTDE